MNGICTLANDRVFDQLVALLNSIEVHAPGMPVCIYPYDDQLDRVRSEIAHRPLVTIYDDRASIEAWDTWVKQAWDAHPTAKTQWRAVGSQGYHRLGTHRRFGAFDGPFDRFLYLDADTLLLTDPTPLFDRLQESDWVVYDFQSHDPGHVYNCNSARLKQVFTPEKLQNDMFCSGFYGAKRGLFPADTRAQLLDRLRSGDVNLLYPMAPDQTLVNYMVMTQGLRVCNLAKALPQEAVTGCCVTSPHFQESEGQVLDGGKKLFYLHYIGLSSSVFRLLCAGQNWDIPYRETFLYYRYLHQPTAKPLLTGELQLLQEPPRTLRERIQGRIQSLQNFLRYGDPLTPLRTSR
jgi:hypothetical protein